MTIDRLINVTVYRDGDPLTPPGLLYNMLVVPNYQHRQYLPLVEGRTSMDQVAVQLIWGEELTDQWWTFRAMLFDGRNGAVLAAERPGLFYAGPTDCPTVVRLPCMRTRMQDHLFGGLLSLALRAADPYRAADVEPPHTCAINATLVDAGRQTSQENCTACQASRGA